VRDAVTEEIFKGADRTEEKIAGQEFERLKFKGGRSMVASRRSEGSHLRCPWKYKIGQLLKNRIIESYSRRRLVRQRFCWFTPPMCPKPKIAVIRGNLAGGFLSL
jgi:hypothetical protein